MLDVGIQADITLVEWGLPSHRCKVKVLGSQGQVRLLNEERVNNCPELFAGMCCQVQGLHLLVEILCEQEILKNAASIIGRKNVHLVACLRSEISENITADSDTIVGDDGERSIIRAALDNTFIRYAVHAKAA